MLGLLGLRIFEATGADIADLGEEHSHRALRVCGKGTEGSRTWMFGGCQRRPKLEQFSAF